MPSTLIKVAIGLAGATTVGGGATAIYLNSGNNKSINQNEISSNTGVQNQSNSPKEVKKVEPEANKVISSLFEGEKITLLTNQGPDLETWKTKWATFKEKYDTLKEKKNWEFEEWTAAKLKQDEENIKVLQQKCNDNSKKNVVDAQSQLFLDVKEFCTKTT